MWLPSMERLRKSGKRPPSKVDRRLKSKQSSLRFISGSLRSMQVSSLCSTRIKAGSSLSTSRFPWLSSTHTYLNARPLIGSALQEHRDRQCGYKIHPNLQDKDYKSDDSEKKKKGGDESEREGRKVKNMTSDISKRKLPAEIQISKVEFLQAVTSEIQLHKPMHDWERRAIGYHVVLSMDHLQ